MIRALILLLALAACGVEGPPLPPEPEAEPTAGVEVSGVVEVGVAGRN